MGAEEEAAVRHPRPRLAVPVCTALILTATVAIAPTVAVARPPNIILILADDVGYGDLRIFGHPYARTPSLDKLARQGMRFTQFYVTGSTCNPSRTGFMTGRYPASFQMRTSRNGFGDSITVTELLAAHGYRTGHFGKWHIGPIHQEGTYGIHDIRTVGSRQDDLKGRDSAVFAAAIDFIMKNREAPFYINIWGHISHAPVDPPDAVWKEFPRFAFDRGDFGFWAQENFDKSQFLIDKYKLSEGLADAMRKYLSEIRALDAQVGSLMKVLDELGLRRQTIVVFSSDQGPGPVFKGDSGYHGRVGNPNSKKNLLGYAGGLRGGKHTRYEGGVRSPLIIRWPGVVPKSRVNRTSLISAVDWLPTLCSIVGIDLDRTEWNIDGEDMSDVWFGSVRSRSRPIFWKGSNVEDSATVRSANWKLGTSAEGAWLFNIAEDPFEMNDLASAHPDVVARLKTEIEDWEVTLPRSYTEERARSPAPPVADAGPDRVVIDEDLDGRAWTRLDAGNSADPDGSISGYVWRRGEETVAVGRAPRIQLEIGEHLLTLEVTDYAGNMGRDRVRLSVRQ